jgi:SNF2 family DNA or RNA helicase
VDSDDEEADGSWLVGEDQRGSLRLGKAGGSEDERAEGAGDWVGADDSVHSSEEEDGSHLDSFVVPDEETKQHVGNGSEDTLLSLGALMSQPKEVTILSQQTNEISDNSDSDASTGSESESESASESGEEEGIDESDLEPSQLFEHRNSAFVPRILASAKIRHLLKILHKEAEEHKFIVFSQFTSMLNLIEPFLRKDGLKFTRYDGGMRNDAREASLEKLRNDKRTRILLCSLKCGSLGLNLTAATRVVIIEPFWNPVRAREPRPQVVLY